MNTEDTSLLITMVKDTAYKFPHGTSKCSLNVSELTENDKVWLVNKHLKENVSTNWISWNWGLNPRTLRKWVLRVKKQDILHCRAGRPSSLTDESKEKLVQYVQAGVHSLRVADFEEKIHVLQLEQAVGSNLCESQVPLMNRRSIRRLRKSLNIYCGNAETTTAARAEAIASILNATSFAAAMEMCKDYYPEIVMNMDGTQYTVGNTDDVKKVVHMGNRGGRRSLKVLPDKSGGGLVKFFIKFYHLITAAGCRADPVFVIADENMGEDDFHVEECTCLANSGGSTSTAYITFTQTRCWNLRGYEWFNNSIMLPLINQTRKRFRFVPGDAALFMLDGEPRQIEIYNQSLMLSTLAEHNVTVVKPSASTTEITQACDAGADFKASKRCLLGIRDCDVSNDHRLPQIRQVFDAHDEFLKVTYPGKNLKFNRVHRKMAMSGLLRINIAQCKAFNINNAKDSFEIIGARPYSINQILKNCTSAISPNMDSLIKKNIGGLAKIMEAKGEIFEEDYFNLGITENNSLSGKNKEDLVVHRRRTTVLTNASFRMRLQAKTDAAAALLIAKENKKELAKTRKVEKAQQKAQKDAQKDAAKAAKRVNNNHPVVFI